MTDKALDIVNTDIGELVSLANTKGLKKIDDLPTKLARLDTLIADGLVKLNNENLAAHIETTGDSCSKRGIIMQINLRIKKHFGFSVSNEMSEFQAKAIASLRYYIARVMVLGVEQKKVKCDIYDSIYRVIENHAKIYHLTEGM